MALKQQLLMAYKLVEKQILNDGGGISPHESSFLGGMGGTFSYVPIANLKCMPELLLWIDQFLYH